MLYVLYLLLVPLAASGFNVKKALFAGGRLSSPENNLLNGGSCYFVVWESFPEGDLYRAEMEAYHALGARKPLEFQVDLVFSAWPWLVSSIVAGLGSWLSAISTSPIVLAPFLFFSFFLLLQMVDERRLFQRRAWEGHV